MKASKQSIGRAVDQPDAQIRLYLFHGPDEANSRALAARLLSSLGATKVAVAPSSLKSDPAALVDEAAALSLFGGARAVSIEPATDEILVAVEALLDAPSVESPVIAIAGALRKTSAVLKLAEASPAALAFASYVPEGQDAERMVIDLGRGLGLKISPSIAARVAAGAGNDQAIARQELQKLALYLDSSPVAPKELGDEALNAVGTDAADADLMNLADLALGGDLDALSGELSRLPVGGSEGIPVVRSLQRRIMQLAPLRARIERGDTADAVMTSMGKSLFWKDKAMIARMLSRWDADRLAKVAERAGRLERALMFSPAPEQEGLGEELLAIAREARRR